MSDEESDDDCLSGPERVELQIQSGVRAFIQELDLLRIKFGFDGINLTVLTPKAEIKARRGFATFVPLRVKYSDTHSKLNVIVSFPINGYPHTLPQIKVGSYLGESLDVEHISELQLELDRFLNSAPREVGLVFATLEHFLTLIQKQIDIKGSIPVDSTASESPSKGIPISAVPDSNKKFGFRCRSCRKHLFREDALVPHSYDNYKTSQVKAFVGSVNNSCTSLFLANPELWMTCADVSGRIICPSAHCSSKLGSYDWSGGKCSCGLWITPSFQFQVCKLDAETLVNTAPEEAQPPPEGAKGLNV